MAGERRSTSEIVVCVDVGSTFTKAAAIDAQGALVAHAESPTTWATDVLHGLDAAVDALGVGRVSDESLLVCSSAGGGLRLAVVGQERVVSVEAGRRVALTAGARVVGVWAGPLGQDAIAATGPQGTHDAPPASGRSDASGPGEQGCGRGPGPVGCNLLAGADVVLLVGGTDGGAQEVLLHNARVLGRSRMRVPIVLAGNQDAGQEALQLLRRGRRVVLQAENVIPRIGELAADSARSAIRSVFIEHVIGGKGLSRGPRFGRLVRCATPDAVLTGVEVLAARRADVAAGDVLVVDIGGATTDVYSTCRHTPAATGTPPSGVVGQASTGLASPLIRRPPAETLVETVPRPPAASPPEAPRRPPAESLPGVVGQAPAERTVEGDLGMRWSAADLVRAAQDEQLLQPGAQPSDPRQPGPFPSPPHSGRAGLVEAADRRHADVGLLPSTDQDLDDELALARLATTIAVRRHARPSGAGRDMRRVGLVVGSGGVLRHAEPERARAVLASLLADRGGGWARPVTPATAVDSDYLLAPIGLLALAGRHAQAEALADRLIAVAGPSPRPR